MAVCRYSFINDEIGDVKMIIHREIKTVHFDVNINTSREIYWPKDAYNHMVSIGYSPNKLRDVFNYLYKIDNSYAPMLGIIELTNKCNFNCPFCFIHNTNNNTVPQSLSYEDIKGTLDWLISHGLIRVTLTGGEPFINADFTRIYKYLKTRGVLVTVFSNLSLLNDELLELFIQYPPLSLETTLYANSNQIFSDVTHQGFFTADDLKNNVLKLKNNGINIICKTPLNVLTYPEFPDIRSWCYANNITYYYSTDILSSYSQKSLDNYYLAPEIITRINETLLSESSKDEFFSDADVKVQVPKQCFDCGAGKYGFHISYQNELRPCMNFFVAPEFCFSLKDGNPEKAYSAMNSLIMSFFGKNITGCTGCEAKSMCRVCAIDECLFQKGNASIISDRCLHYKKMYRELRALN